MKVVVSALCREGCNWMAKIMDRFVEGKFNNQEVNMLLEISKQIEGNIKQALEDAKGYV